MTDFSEMNRGDVFLCVVCRRATVHEELGYHDSGVCAYCVRDLANAYGCEHGDGPIQVFCSESDWARVLEQKKNKKKQRRLGRTEWSHIRLQIAARDGLKCHYCNSDLPPSTFAVDHIIPVSRGGTHELENLVASCKSCNSKKGAKDYSAFVNA